jgi:2-polyprenyl-3-methyl-5-hydroxy-6-metoxy-1,4-benzoquinol methylase
MGKERGFFGYMSIQNLILNFRNFFHLILRRQRSFIGEEGERFVPKHPSMRIDESSPVDFGGFYKFASQFVNAKSVLDVGCGYGYGIEYLLRKGAASCVGLDYSEKAIKFAKRIYQDSNLQYYVMDANNLSYFNDQSFDVVLSIEVIEHLPDANKHISEISRVMKTGGILVLSTPNKEMTSAGQRPLGKFHTNEFYYQELRGLLRKYFSEVVIFENLLISPFPEGQSRKQEREKRGEIGYTWAPAVKTKHFIINCQNLYSHSHSFVAVCSQKVLPTECHQL